MAVASLILGIISIVFSLIPFINFIGFIMGTIGIILASISLKTLKSNSEPTGIATGGLVTSIIGAAIGGLIYITCFACTVGSTSCLNKDAFKNMHFNVKQHNNSKNINLDKMDKKLRQMSNEQQNRNK